MSNEWIDDVAIDRQVGERDAADTGKRLMFEELEDSVSEPMIVWFSPHGTEWTAETYEEALEQERDTLADRVKELERLNSGLTRDFNAMLVSNSRAEAEVVRWRNASVDQQERVLRLRDALTMIPEKWQQVVRDFDRPALSEEPRT